MNEILKIANELKAENISICNRCLGRLFGKLGYGLDNPTRGTAVLFLSHLKDVIDDESNNNGDSDFTDIRDIIDNFSFDNWIIAEIAEILGFEHRASENETKTNNKKDIDNKNFNDAVRNILNREDLENLTKLSGLNPPQSNSTEFCSICQGLFDELPNFVNLVCDQIKDYEFNDFLLGCKLDYDLVAAEEALWSRFGTKHPEAMKTEFNRELGKLVEAQLDKPVNFDTPEMTIIVDTLYEILKLQIASLFIYGRYKKLSREIPQTRWPCKRCWGKGCDKCNGTGKLYDTSVEEEIAKIVMKYSKGKAHFFHGMGREDIGVRMLGTGRPFILEISEPIHRKIDLENLQQQINLNAKGMVEVSDLAFTQHRAVRELKAAKPNKTYNVKVEFEKKLDKGKLKDVLSTFADCVIQQQTPRRVAHRRADLVRERAVIDMSLSALTNDGKCAEIKITGESGLYIKELIHGDLSRTKPSLAEELGLECTVLELDVLQINDN